MNRLQNSNLPFINLSKENLFLLCDTIELDEIGLIITALKDYIYDGVEPNFERKALIGAWKQVLLLVDRKADGCFKHREQMEKINKNKKEKKGEDTNVLVTGNTADLKPSNNEIIPTPQPIDVKPLEAIKTAIEDEIEITTNTEKNMRTLTNIIQKQDGTFEKIEELNNKTITNDFSAIETLIPRMNKEMALKQVKPYLSKETNMGRLNDSLSTFLNGITLDERINYYNFILEQFFAVA